MTDKYNSDRLVKFPSGPAYTLQSAQQSESKACCWKVAAGRPPSCADHGFLFPAESSPKVKAKQATGFKNEPLPTGISNTVS